MLVRRLVRMLALCGALLGMALTGPALAAGVITMTATGTVTSGTDHDGSLTGTPGTNLSGLSVTLTQVFTVSPGTAYAMGPGFTSVAFDVVSSTVAIGALPALTFTEAGAVLASGIYTISAGGLGPFYVDGQVSIDLAGGQTFFSQANISSLLDPFLASAALDQDFSFSAPPPNGTWSLGASLSDSGTGNPFWDVLAEGLLTLDITATGFAAVPEPGTFVLLALGLAGLMAAARRGRRVAAGAS